MRDIEETEPIVVWLVAPGSRGEWDVGKSKVAFTKRIVYGVLVEGEGIVPAKLTWSIVFMLKSSVPQLGSESLGTRYIIRAM